jgi:hypothetical protein
MIATHFAVWCMPLLGALPRFSHSCCIPPGRMLYRDAATTKNASEKEGLSGAIQMDNPVVDGITGLDTCDNPGHQMPMGASMNEHMPTASAIFGPGRQDATELRELMSG